MGEVADRFDQFAASAGNTLAKTHRALDTSFASLVKVDHVIYKQRAYMALVSDGDEQHVHAVGVNDHDCRLGKWYYTGDGKERFGKLASYRAMESPHHTVHHAAQAMLALLRQEWDKDPDLQQAIFARLEAMEQASQQVMDIIGMMVVEKHGEAAAVAATG
ncbi:MAG TPA: CZB domain-containing protein [Thiobacillaceae bacterium]|nr:CZB domain-containing protein [Thiobacillaceae bacterium]